MNLVFVTIGLIVGGGLAWIISSLLIKLKMVSKKEYDTISQKSNLLHTELEVEKQRAVSLQQVLHNLDSEIIEYKSQINSIQKDVQSSERTISTLSANLTSAQEANKNQLQDIYALKEDLKTKTEEFNELNKITASLTANNRALTEKLNLQKNEIQEIHKQFNLEFQSIASRILDEKTDKFTKLNQDNLNGILKPLGENIDLFKKKVEEVYITEAKERFSLGEELKKLQVLNVKLSEEASNLTNALTGSSKTQGDWGQMILENILEKSGLVINREYFVQEYLKDKNGSYLINEQGNRMQPDIIIAYPDDRKVIVDSKVSISAYTRYASCNNREEQNSHLKDHLRSMRRHIDDLSKKNYQDYATSLDFVMMFVPNEPAYLLALQNDPDMWHYAYDKKILLISPTNLIAALKLIEDLWKREYQNRNAQEIADRGAALYDKLVNFVESFISVGEQLSRAQTTYDTAFGQLSKGRGNLIGHAEKLKDLGLKSKKTLPASLVERATSEK